MKFSVTGKESGGSDTGAITPVRGEYLQPFGNTPNDLLKRHRAAQDGVDLFPANRIMEAGNRFEGVIREWFQDDFNIKVKVPTKGYRNEHCNLVASLDGIIDAGDGFTITDHLGKDHTFKGDDKKPGLGVIDFKHPIRTPKDPEGLPYVFQMQAQMDCFGSDWAILAYLARMTSDWTIVVVYRHEPTIKAIRDAVDVFWDHMENDTDYPPSSSSEASKMIGGNRRPEPVDLRDGPTEQIMNDARQDLMDASDNWLMGKRAMDAAKEMMSQRELEIKTILGGHESALLPDNVIVSHKTVEYKAQPEKTKVTPAKDAYTTRRFKVEIKA